MNCKSVQNYLSAYLDGELCGHESLEVRQHLSDCYECSAEERQLRALKQMLQGLPTYHPQDGFEDRLIATVISKPARRPLFALNLDWRLATGLAAVSAIAAFAVVKVTERQVPSSDTSSIASRDPFEYDLARDQLFMAGHDPLGGGFVSFASNGQD